jgi:Uma2 family endonuclease
MSRTTPRGLIEITYYDAAQEYLRSLPPEHFMEAVPQATQRKITVASMELVQAQRPDVQTFNELLVQYPREGERRPGQVVPDNMVVVHGEPINAETSFDLPLQPARPFCVMEYVSKKSKRKDYERNFDRYEKELGVPYYLLFYPDTQDLTLYRLSGKRYRSVKPNGGGRCALPELELEVALLDGWVRFWFRGELLPLPADLLRELTLTREQLTQTRQRLEQSEQQREELQRRLAEAEKELARLRAKPSRPRKKPSNGS